MAEKVIQTRIINKHGALADWLTSKTVLKEGEIALAYVETTKPNGQGGYYTVPTYLMKVGDGQSTFSGLEWVAAPASDVYEWAKKANLALSDIPMADVVTELQKTFYTESEIESKISTINTAIDGRAPLSHTHGNITNDGKLGTASRVIITGTDNKITVSDITTTELGYLDGVTSNIQTQLNEKAAKATTLAGYEIGDAYTKSEVDAKLAEKQGTHDHPYLSNTTKYALSDSVGGDALKAKQVANSFTVQLNSGSTEGTNKFTFNGSTAKTVNVTPSAIGTYTKAEIDAELAKKHNTHEHPYAPTEHNHDTRYYTKEEIISKLSSVLNYKGTKDTTSNLPTSGNVTGDVWNITNACAATSTLPKVNAGDNVAWNGSSWDVLAGTVDLSNYYTKGQVDSELTKYSATHDHPYLSNTTKYAASSSVGGAATSADKVNKSLVVKLNSGTTEGTNLFTFDGSTAKSVNVTPSAIGAYTKGEVDAKLAEKQGTHDHPYLPDTTKYAGSATQGGAANSVANSITVQLNGGTTEGTNKFTFNGSAAKTINITASAVGAYTTSEIDSKVSAINTSIDSIFNEIVFDCGGPNN